MNIRQAKKIVRNVDATMDRWGTYHPFNWGSYIEAARIYFRRHPRVHYDLPGVEIDMAKGSDWTVITPDLGRYMESILEPVIPGHEGHNVHEGNCVTCYIKDIGVPEVP